MGGGIYVSNIGWRLGIVYIDFSMGVLSDSTEMENDVKHF
jgi:hypothetical protein